MKRILLAISIFIFTQISLAQVPCSNMVYGGEFPRAPEPVTILCKKEFVVGYSTSRKTLLWAAYVLEPRKILLPAAVSSLNFKVDPTIPKEFQATLEDYTNSGFDRGHMVPFEDVNHDYEAAVESMYLTNIIPQYSISNRGIWRVLESKIRSQALGGQLYVIVGPVFEGNVQTVGPSKLPVPSKLYRVVIDPKSKTSTSYLVPHIPQPIPSIDIPKLITTRDTVKKLTRIELVPAIILIDSK